ncbi:MAG: GNAT family N-acetyltransferase [Thermoanaerobaculia bacterium]
MITSERIQSYFREVARRQYEVVSLPPFTLFFHPSDPLPFLNYAIPDIDDGRALAEPLKALRAEFGKRVRIPRFEFVEAFAPALGCALAAAGFQAEPAAHLMVADAGTAKPAQPVSELRIDVVTRGSHLEEIRRLLFVQRAGFGLPDPTLVSDADATWFQTSLGDGKGFVAWLGEAPVAGGVLMPAIDGIAEIAGIATMDEFRKRGIGAAITGMALRAALDAGVETVVLSAADAKAGRVYEAVGFRAFGSTLFYRESALQHP